MNRMTAVSLFAGIEGLGRAFHLNGVRVVAAVEIDVAARGVIHDRTPDTTLFTDVCEVTADELRAAGFDPDNGVLLGGWPCQDLSVAGRRLGLGGARSGLFWEVIRLLADLRPRWFCLENVPGLLSAVCACPGLGHCGGRVTGDEWGNETFHPCDDPHPVRGGICGYTPAAGGRCMELHGGAMGAVLGALAELGYGVAYRVLDAQYLGVPQRRRRVVLVGCLGDWAAPAEVLLEPEGRGGDSAPRRAAGPRTAVVSALCAGSGGGCGPDDNDATGGRLIASTVSAKWAKGTGGPAGDEVQNLVPVSIAVAGDFSTGEDVAQTIRGANGQPGTVAVPILAQAVTDRGNCAGDIAPTLKVGHNASGPHHTAISTTTAVRRLTPTECERLQGYPDGWTATSWGKPQADSPRYRQLGNSVAVPVFAWVARRMVRAHGQLLAHIGSEIAA